MLLQSAAIPDASADLTSSLQRAGQPSFHHGSGWLHRPAHRGTRSAIAQRRVLGRRVSHFRGTPCVSHAPVSFDPGGKRFFNLGPVRDRGLIAPVEKVRHCLLMGAVGHVPPHTLLAIPGGHRPEGPATVGQNGSGVETRGFPDLAQRAKSMKDELRYEPDGPNPEAGQANENHIDLTLVHACELAIPWRLSGVKEMRRQPPSPISLAGCYGSTSTPRQKAT